MVVERWQHVGDAASLQLAVGFSTSYWIPGKTHAPTSTYMSIANPTQSAKKAKT
jgi:hypothetical protein